MRIISGKFRNHRLLSPSQDEKIRPTSEIVREALFNICQGEIKGAEVLDLFSGSGAIGYEAISQGASHVTFVEKNPTAIQRIRRNIVQLKIEAQTTLYTGDALSLIPILSRKKKRFHLIYIDPPYEKIDIDESQSIYTRILHSLDTCPLFAPSCRIFLERARRKGEKKQKEQKKTEGSRDPFRHFFRERARYFGKSTLERFVSLPSSE